ncbi:MAG: hypothetical protein JSR66_23890 [Proteobacteria bacterium]|nr:hypothetical protein [Pseudomonadota bacterium]
MNTRTTHIGAVQRWLTAAQAGGLAALLVAAAPLAFAQSRDAPPAASQSAATQPPPAAADSGGSSSSTSGVDSKSEPVCFKLTGHCVDASKAPAGSKAGTAAAKNGAQAKGKKLNLTAPDVRSVVPEQELKEPLPSEKQITEVQESQTVSVKTDEGVPPDVPMGLGAIWWAVVHPSQAWRILTPE